jgi:hypothetical protein
MGAYTNSKYAAQIAINNADDAIIKEKQTLGKMGTLK